MNLLANLSSYGQLLPLVMFIVVSSITPGPNNVMLTASGANFGYQRSIPHMLGISVGGSVQLLMVGSGLGAVFAQVPLLYTAVQCAGAAYLIWLAWKIARSAHIETGIVRAQPLSFWQAASFQWVNPKAWLMSIGIVAAYTSPSTYWLNLLLAAMLMPLVNYPCISVWTLFGSGIGHWLQSPRSRQWFNWSMAGLLLLSLWPMLQPTSDM